MSTPAGALAARSDQGAPVLSGTVSATPQQTAVKGFIRVIHDILGSTRVYHNESEHLQALDALRAYERHLLGSYQDSRAEDDRAPVEDVSKRIPAGGVQAPVPAGMQIDYAKLAAALVAAQQAQQQANAEPPVEGTVVQ